MARAYVYMKVSDYSQPNALFLCTLQRFCWLSFGWHHEPNFWLSWGNTDWSSAFCDRETNVLSVACTVHIRFVRFTPVTHTAKSVSWPFFVRYLSVTYAFYAFREATETTFITGWTPDKHFLHFFCPFGVRYPYPLICDSTIITLSAPS